MFTALQRQRDCQETLDGLAGLAKMASLDLLGYQVIVANKAHQGIR